MCGFVQRVTDSPAVIALLEQVGLGELTSTFKKESGGKLNFYPAFGKNPDRKLTNLIINPTETIDATWWFDCKTDGESLAVGERTTFNARNLDSPFWKGAIRHHRGIVVATAVGESNKVGKSNEHYLMESEGALLLGAVYRTFDNGCYSSAVITRPPHERFSQYHEKSIPCFLPPDKAVIDAWLNGGPDDPLVDDVLNDPRIYQDLKVTNVETFKDGKAKAKAELEILHKD
mgnify:CR=1 FL=1